MGAVIYRMILVWMFVLSALGALFLQKLMEQSEWWSYVFDFSWGLAFCLLVFLLLKKLPGKEKAGYFVLGGVAYYIVSDHFGSGSWAYGLALIVAFVIAHLCQPLHRRE